MYDEGRPVRRTTLVALFVIARSGWLRQWHRARGASAEDVLIADPAGGRATAPRRARRIPMPPPAAASAGPAGTRHGTIGRRAADGLRRASARHGVSALRTAAGLRGTSAGHKVTAPIGPAGPMGQGAPDGQNGDAARPPAIPAALATAGPGTALRGRVADGHPSPRSSRTQRAIARRAILIAIVTMVLRCASAPVARDRSASPKYQFPITSTAPCWTAQCAPNFAR